MISRRTPGFLGTLFLHKTSRGTLPVNSNRTGYCERSLLISRNIFNDRGIYVIFIQTHLHLHRCGIVGEFHSSEVVKEEQDAETDTDGIGNFQDSIAGCGLPGDLGVDLLEKNGDVYVIVKGHNGKACTEKGGEADKYDFAPSYNNIDSSFLLIGDDEVWFANMRNIKIRLFELDIIYKIHNRNHIPACLVRIQVCYRENP